MNTKKWLGLLVLLILGLGIGFWGGTTYQKSQKPLRGSFAQFNGSQNGASRTGMGARAGAFASGDIVATGNGTLTLGLQDGSSKLVLIGSSTQIMKEASGTQSDLAKGVQVTVTGTPNSDGSVSAQSIQIRPTDNSTARHSPMIPVQQ